MGFNAQKSEFYVSLMRATARRPMAQSPKGTFWAELLAQLFNLQYITK